ncbi:MAG: RNA pseudouridine synthase [Bdellovibrio sp.]|nr:RNA pseudouridine synthase [Bdellovibrio sp.]
MKPAQKLPVVEKSKHWLIINKPTGISVHNEAGDVRSILKKQLHPGTFHDIYPVHRLDKETSGLLVVATEQEAAASLSEQFQNHKAEKMYYAVLRGPMDVSDEWQEWAFPISDKAEGRKNPQGLLKDRIEAKTLYRVLESNKFFSLVELRLLTGRQHQIRKHSALAKHAIVGDPRYNDPTYNSKMAKIYGNDRMYLHAFRLTLPIGGRVQTFETPVPPDFKKLFQS